MNDSTEPAADTQLLAGTGDSERMRGWLTRSLARQTASGSVIVVMPATDTVNQLSHLLTERGWDREPALRTAEWAYRQYAPSLCVHTRSLHFSSVHRSFERALEEVLRTLTRQVRPPTLRASTGTTDALDLAAQAFVETLLQSATALDKLEPDEAKRLGERAAEQVIASAHWARVVGDRLDTTQATRLLGISRQALAKRQTTGSVLALPGNGTSWYPVWQFDVDQAAIRPEARDIIGAFHERLDEVDPLLIASWATTPQPEDLAGETPAQWLISGRDPEQLRHAAIRAASRLSH